MGYYDSLIYMEHYLEGIKNHMICSIDPNIGAPCEAAYNKSYASSQIKDKIVTFSSSSGNRKESQVGVLLICTSLP